MVSLSFALKQRIVKRKSLTHASTRSGKSVCYVFLGLTRAVLNLYLVCLGVKK